MSLLVYVEFLKFFTKYVKVYIIIKIWSKFVMYICMYSVGKELQAGWVHV